jgi:hypothetical protein
MDIAAARFGFEGALVTCGKVVNQDGSLGLAHTTAGAAGVRVFFCTMGDVLTTLLQCSNDPLAMF